MRAPTGVRYVRSWTRSHLWWNWPNGLEVSLDGPHSRTPLNRSHYGDCSHHALSQVAPLEESLIEGKAAVGLDKEYEPGGSFDRRATGRHIASRPKREHLLEVPCPRCGVAAGCWCDRSRDRGYLRTVRGLRLFAEGTPDSHQERKWSWQGHDPAEFADLWERERSSRSQDDGTDEAAMVIADVRCPVHGAGRGTSCPGSPGVCKPRVQKWIKARDQKIAKVQQRRSAARGRAASHDDTAPQARPTGKPAPEKIYAAVPPLDECQLCMLASIGVLGIDPSHKCTGG